eukprot:sb/3472215/
MAAQVDRFRKSIEDFLVKYPCVDNVVQQASDKTKVSKVNLVMGVVGFTAVWLAIGYGSPFLCDFIGFIFPAYLSFKAVESADTRDDTQWLTYWIVYSYFGILEFFSDYILFWIPFYSLIKCCFLLWMVNYNGASLIYTRFIRYNTVIVTAVSFKRSGKGLPTSVRIGPN